MFNKGTLYSSFSKTRVHSVLKLLTQSDTDTSFISEENSTQASLHTIYLTRHISSPSSLKYLKKFHYPMVMI